MNSYLQLTRAQDKHKKRNKMKYSETKNIINSLTFNGVCSGRKRGLITIQKFGQVSGLIWLKDD